MIEASLLISSSLLVITLGMVFVYFRKMREISERYIEAKSVLSDIILSFKMDLRKHDSRISSISQTIEGLSLRDKDSRRIKEIRDEFGQLRHELSEASTMRLELSAKIKELAEKVQRLILRQEENMKEIVRLEASKPKGSAAMDRIEGVIPIRSERALAALTETELRVLEVLATEGDKAAPQIKDKIKLTREHTARLMKSLYTRGYVERRTDRLPYLYRIKGEMLKILKKRTRSEAT